MNNIDFSNISADEIANRAQSMAPGVPSSLIKSLVSQYKNSLSSSSSSCSSTSRTTHNGYGKVSSAKGYNYRSGRDSPLVEEDKSKEFRPGKTIPPDHNLSPDDMKLATKHARFSVSALQFDDVGTAIKYLNSALSILEGDGSQVLPEK